jgi:hypothetical protein
MERDEHVHSIEVRLADAKREVSEAKQKVRCINEELKDAMQQVFEQRLGVKDGDIITTKTGTKFYYERFFIDTFGEILILCHPVKNDGTASKAIRHMFYGEFIACI